MKDPNTGQFTPGNPGRPKGTKNVRTLQWEELGDTITGYHADQYTTLLDELWQSKDMAERMKAADLYLRTLDYFKPKLQRIQIPAEPVTIPTPIITMQGCGECSCPDCQIIPHGKYPHAAHVKQLDNGIAIVREVIGRTPPPSKA
jgi:hypothetical protein